MTTDELSERFITRIKVTMAIDVSRFMSAGLPPKAIVEKLFEIPEVADAFYLRSVAKRDRQGNWSLPSVDAQDNAE